MNYDAKDLLAFYKGADSFDSLWVGPHVPAKHDLKGEKTAELRRAFREHNLIRELVDNWADGIISKPFNFTVKGGESESERATEALRAWIDEVNRFAVVANPASSDFQRCNPWENFVLSLGVLGRSSLRLWQHPTTKAFHLHTPLHGAVNVEYDDFTDIERITYSAGTTVETHERDGDRMLVASSLNGESSSETYNTQGRWFIQVMHGESLITPSVVSKQSALDHDLTMLMRNQEQAGFKRRTLLNAEMPLEGEEYEIGPGIDEYVEGVQDQQADGSYKRITPTIHESQPFPVDNFEKSIAIWTELAYREFRQTHLLEHAGANLSGEALLQRRASLLVFLQRWRLPVESAFSNALSLYLQLLGFKDVEAVVDLQLSTGPMSAEEKNTLMTQHDKGLLSRRSTIGMLNSVTDADAEIEELENELRSQTESDPFENPST